MTVQSSLMCPSIQRYTGPRSLLALALAAALLVYASDTAAQAASPTAAPKPTLQDHANRALDALGAGLVSTGRFIGRTAPEVISAPDPGDSRRVGEADRSIGAGERLSLLRFWQVAQINDHTYRAARAARLGANEKLSQARAQLLPQVQMTAIRAQNSLTREGVNSLTQQQTLFDRYPSGNQTLSIRQQVVRPTQWFTVAQAAYQIDDAQAVLMRERQNLAIRVAGFYFEALLAQDALTLNRAQQSFLAVQLDASQKALAAGAGTRTDIDDAKAKLDLSRAQELEYQQYVDLTRRQLELMVGQPFGGLRGLASGQLPALVSRVEPLPHWLSLAMSSSPEIRSVQAQIDSARMEVSKTRSAHLPTLDVVATSQRSRSENAISPQSQFMNSSVALQLTVPIYSGGLVNSVTRQASAEVERLTELMEALRMDLSLRIQKEYRGLTEGAARVSALEQALASADVALDSAQKSFGAGLRTRIDVLNAMQQRMVVLRDLSQARYSTLVSAIRLETLAGQVDGGVMERVNAALEP